MGLRSFDLGSFLIVMSSCIDELIAFDWVINYNRNSAYMG